MSLLKEYQRNTAWTRG